MVDRMLYIVSAGYDPKSNGVILKLYDSSTERIVEWIDKSYKAYFLSKYDSSYKGVERIEQVVRFDGITQKDVNMFKHIVKNPSFVKLTHELPECYENHVKFFQGYIYDNDIEMGLPYELINNKLTFKKDVEVEERIKHILGLMNTEGEQDVFENWARIMEYSAPNFKRLGLDIEVLNVEKRMPNANSANLPVICVCCVSSKGEKAAFVLIQPNKSAPKICDENIKTFFFSSEEEMLRSLFQFVNNYPFVITFNGDDFDLTYLANRALRLGIPECEIPIEVKDRITLLKNGIHIDLYKFFSIKAMRVYAFQQKYKNVDLDTISNSLLGKGKLNEGHKWVADMSYDELIKYCMRDSELTLELTTYNDNLVINLMLILERISRMPIENVTRKSVSSWIMSFMVYEHRRKGYLIPKGEEIRSMKGEVSSSALIKGKKYKGAVVIPPKGGTHFNTKVGDFASLYPSIIKIYNIGYETVRCSHEECKSNKVGELPHWICKKTKSMESMLIGSLRDLRVNWYKQKSKDKNLNKEQQTWYKVAEQSIKVIMNASYGVFGAETFEFYCPPAAEEITAIGRFIITQTINHGQELGLEILYGDTDSIFIKNPDDKKMEELIVWTKKTFDIEFELDKSYRYICLSERKKNYLGVLTDGTVDVKGLTGKKKHTPSIIKNTFENVKSILSKVNNENEIDDAKRQIIGLIKSTYVTIKCRKWNSLDELAFNVNLTKEIKDYGKAIEIKDKTIDGSDAKSMLKNVPQHVRAAKMLEEQLHDDIGIGSSISYVKTNPKLTNGETIKPLQLAKPAEIDAEKYLEFLKSTFEQILEPLGIDFKEDIEGKRLIESWFNQ